MLLALLLASPPEQVEAAGTVTSEPAPALATAPAPTAPAPAPAPAPQPHYEAPPSSGPVAREPEQTGVGLLVAGPLTVAVGIPFSFLGNKAWRDNCGPTSSNKRCADGTFAAIAGHTLTGFAFAGGIAMTGAGGARKGRYDAAADPTRSGTGFVVGGAVLLPVSLIGMGITRLLLWLPTPDCLNYACVERYQNLSTVTVGGLALTASMGAGLLMYGAGYNKHRPRYSQVAVLPQLGRGFTGLSLAGQF